MVCAVRSCICDTGMSKRSLYDYFSVSEGPIGTSCATVSEPDGHSTTGSGTKRSNIIAAKAPAAKRRRPVGRPRKKPVIIDLDSSDGEVAGSVASKTTQVAGTSERESTGINSKLISRLLLRCYSNSMYS